MALLINWTVTQTVVVIKVVSILLVLAVSVYSFIHQYGFILTPVDLKEPSLHVPHVKFVLGAVSPDIYIAFYGLTWPSLCVPHSKFVLSAVSPELRNYDVVELSVNCELKKYYIYVSDRCPTVVDCTAVHYCPPKHSSQVVCRRRCTTCSQIVRNIWKVHPAWLPPLYQKTKIRKKTFQVVHLRLIHFIQMVWIFHS